MRRVTGSCGLGHAAPCGNCHTISPLGIEDRAFADGKCVSGHIIRTSPVFCRIPTCECKATICHFAGFQHGNRRIRQIGTVRINRRTCSAIGIISDGRFDIVLLEYSIVGTIEINRQLCGIHADIHRNAGELGFSLPEGDIAVSEGEAGDLLDLGQPEQEVSGRERAAVGGAVIDLVVGVDKQRELIVDKVAVRF